MVLILSLTPINEISSKEDLTSQDWFLLQTNIKTKSITDSVINTVYERLLLYSLWYTENPHMYLMTDNYYYKTNIYDMLPRSYQTVIQNRMPKYIKHDDPNYMSKYPMVNKVTITETDIEDALKTLLENNFKENPIIHTILGGKLHV